MKQQRYSRQPFLTPSIWLMGLLLLMSFVFSLVHSTSVNGATNSTLNFQARLLTSGGGIVADGNYHIEFKLYSASSGGSALWTETRTTGNLVPVKAGYLTVNLGSVTAFPTNINWDQDLWITMNVGGHSGSATWDGEMSPRLKLTAVPYAFRAGQLAQYNQTTGFTSTLSLLQPTGGNQIFQIPDQGAAGTYTLLTGSAANGSYIQLQSTTPGTAQTGNFNITGRGIASTLQAATFDTASAVALNIGTTNATLINLNKSTFVTSASTALTIQSSTVNAPVLVLNNADGTVGLEFRSGGSGLKNSFVGYQAGMNATTGDSNAAFGYQAGYSNTSGTKNTFIGYQAGYQDPVTTTFATLSNLTNATAIGYGAQVQSSNSIVLGGANSNAVSVGIGTTIPQNTLSVSPLSYNTGTASQSGVTITGVGTTWTASMVGSQFIFANGMSATITGFTNGTSLTGSVSQTVASQVYRIHRPALQVTSAGNVGIGTSSPTAALDVVGNIYASQGIRTGGANVYDGQVTFYNDSSLFAVTLASGTTAANYTLTLPTAVGASGDCLKETTGTGVLGFGSCAAGPTPTLQQAYSSSTGGTTPEIILDSTRTSLDVQGYSGQSADLLSLRSYTASGLGTLQFGVSPTGTATAATSFLAPAFDTASGVALNIGTANATAINLGRTGVATAIGGNATVAGRLSISTATILSNNQLLVYTNGATNSAAIFKGFTGQSQDLVQMQNVGADILSAFDANGQLTLGRVATTGTTQAGTLGFSDGTLDGFKATLNVGSTALTTNQTINLGNQSGTICVQNSASCGFAPGTNASYIRNGSTQQTSANFNIDGTGTAGTLQASTIDTAAAGILGIGTTNATSINLAKNTTASGTLSVEGGGAALSIKAGATADHAYMQFFADSQALSTRSAYLGFGSAAGTTFTIANEMGGTINMTASSVNVAGNLNQSGGTFSLAGNNNSSVATTAGTLTLQSVNASTGIILNGTANTITMDTGSAGTITVGSSNTSTVNVGAQTNNARTINIGYGAATTAQTINIGSTATTSATSIYGGSGGIQLTTASSTGNVTIKNTNATGSATVLRVQNAVNNNVLTVDTTASTRNIVTNSGFESGTAGWSAKGSAVIAQSSLKYYGNFSMRIGTTALANDGAKYPVTLTPSTQHDINFVVRSDADFSTMVFGYSADGTNETTYVSGAQNVTTGWTRVTLSFTTPASFSGTPYLFIKQTDAIARNMYIDGVQFIGAGSNESYSEARISIGGDNSVVTALGIGTSTPEAAVHIQQALGQTGLLVRGNSDQGLFAPFAFAVQDGGGTNRIFYQEAINQTTINGGHAFWDTPALHVSPAAPSVVALRLQTAAGQTADIFQIRNSSNTALSRFTNNGSLIVKNGNDTNIAFQVQNAAGTDVITVDTTNSQVLLRNKVDNATRGSELITSLNMAAAPPWTSTGWTVTNTVQANAETVARTNVTTITFASAHGLDPNDMLFIDNVGTDYYTRVLTVPNTTTVTVSTTISYDASAPISAVLATHVTGNTSVLATSQVSVTPGATYEVSYTVIGAVTAGQSVTMSIGGGSGRAIATNSVSEVSVVTAINSNPLTFTPTSTWTGIITAVSVKLITPAGATLAVNNAANSTTLEVRAANSNVAIGPGSLQYTIASATQNTAVGAYTLQTNTTGHDNTAIGAFSMWQNTSGYWNTALGGGSLQDNTTGFANTALGYNALTNNTIGTHNAALGLDALRENTTGSYNVALGKAALGLSTTSSYNTAVGYESMLNLTSGSQNTAVGYKALQNDTSGYLNTAVGYLSLTDNTTAHRNTAVGHSSLRYSTTGSDNAALGYGALQTNTTGSLNAALGVYALATNTTGAGNTAIGYGADVASAALTNATAIGYSAVVGSSDSLVLGSTGTYAVNVGIGVSAPAAGLHINRTLAWGGGWGKSIRIDGSGGASTCGTVGCNTIEFNGSAASGSIWGQGVNSVGNMQFFTATAETASTNTTRLTIANNGNLVVNGSTNTCTIGAATTMSCTSDARLKTNVATYSGGLDQIMALRPVNYTWKDLNKSQATNLGFIAQEVQALFPQFVNVVDEETGTLGLDYAGLITPTIAAVQQQQGQINVIKDQLASGSFSDINVSGAGSFGSLFVSGTATISNLVVANAAVTGNLTVQGLLSVQNIAVNGHIISAGNVPTVLAKTAACELPTLLVEGTDTAGIVTVTAGANCTVGGEVVEVKFDKVYDKAPVVTLTSVNEASANIKYYVTQNADGFIVNAPAILESNKEYKFNYHVIQ